MKINLVCDFFFYIKVLFLFLYFRYKSNEEYIYVRGRGRGKYICGECGIRCKKPSMLKKHIRTHTDVRPYICKHCNFAFKTKGKWMQVTTAFQKKLAHCIKCKWRQNAMICKAHKPILYSQYNINYVSNVQLRTNAQTPHSSSYYTHHTHHRQTRVPLWQKQGFRC